MRVWLLRIIPSLLVLLLVWSPISQGVMLSGHEIYSIHTASYFEEFCTEYVDGDVSQATGDSVITDILYLTKPSEDWDRLAFDSGIGGYRISFWPKQTACNELSPTERNNTEIQYILHEVTMTDLLCGTDMPGASNPDKDGVNCSLKDGPILQTHSPHSDYQRSIIHLNDAYVQATSLGQHTINHETGHTLGFGGDISTCPESSIMYYGCGTLAWPTSNDRTAAENLANSADY